MTVTVRNDVGDPLEGLNVTLDQGGGGSVVTPASTTTDGGGVATFTVRSTTVETVTYTAVAEGVAVGTAEVEFTAPTVDAANSTVTATPAGLLANGVSAATITVTALDADGEPVAGAPVTLAQGAGASVITDVSPTTDAEGVATFSVASTTADVVTYTATAGGVPLADDATVTFLAPAVDADTSTVDASPAIVLSDGIATSTVTVTVRDGDGVPMAGVPVTLAQGAGSSMIVDVAPVTDGAGEAVFTVSNEAEEQVIYEATAAATLLTDTAQVDFVADPLGIPDAVTSTVEASPASRPADGASAATVTVTVRNLDGDPIAGINVTLDQGAGSSAISAQSGPSGVDGIVTFTVSNVTVELVTYAATADGIAITDTASVNFTGPGPGPGGGGGGGGVPTSPTVPAPPDSVDEGGLRIPVACASVTPVNADGSVSAESGGDCEVQVAVTGAPGSLAAGDLLVLGMVTDAPAQFSGAAACGSELVGALAVQRWDARRQPIAAPAADTVTLRVAVGGAMLDAVRAPESLSLARWSEGGWQPVATALTLGDGVATLEAEVDRFGIYALFHAPNWGQFTPAPFVQGPTLGIWGGGGFGLMPPATSYWVLDDGRFVGFTPGAPAFVNAAFGALFPGATIPPCQVMVVMR